MLADKREQDARTTLDYQNEFIKWYGYLRHAALVPPITQCPMPHAPCPMPHNKIKYPNQPKEN
ncbi:hypothetical protein H6G33_31605 [Calothrix sp. FACHB-1219]|uniref:hypothetical protein n=1 Tax=unclassified Calothrix TaxID=2619626 RepID=UPI00168999AC|nr:MULTISPECIES: hypothetical protein [unclassified Calothrix]MBD2206900.1 hypothetical protein [Calothrix sp. FACHB-168]MBD2221518.1 hypothetical protein [Calothrix sp. FACHB-1219]